MISSLKSHRLEIGIFLAMAGVQISLVIKELFSISFDVTNVVLFLSIVLIPDYTKLFSGKLPLHGKQMGLTLGYNIYVVALAFVSGASMWTTGTGIIYTLYTIVFILALMTNTREIDGEYLVALTWSVMGMFSMLLFYLVTNGFTSFGGTFQYLSSGADRLSLSVIPFYNLCSALVFHPKNKFFQAFKAIFAIIALYDIMACSRRGLMVALVIILAYHLWQNADIKVSIKGIIRTIGIIVGVLLVFEIVVNLIPGFSDLMGEYISRLTLGISTYFGDTSEGTDAAAINRNTNINGFASLFGSGTLLQQLFGRGYAYFWMDVPYLEAFIDLGILGGTWYLVVQLFMPLQDLLKKTDNIALRFAQYLAIATVTYNIYSGVCYGNSKFVPVVVLFYTAYTVERQCSFNELWGGAADR